MVRHCAIDDRLVCKVTAHTRAAYTVALTRDQIEHLALSCRCAVLIDIVDGQPMSDGDFLCFFPLCIEDDAAHYLRIEGIGGPIFLCIVFCIVPAAERITCQRGNQTLSIENNVRHALLILDRNRGDGRCAHLNRVKAYRIAVALVVKLQNKRAVASDGAGSKRAFYCLVDCEAGIALIRGSSFGIRRAGQVLSLSQRIGAAVELLLIVFNLVVRIGVRQIVDVDLRCFAVKGQIVKRSRCLVAVKVLAVRVIAGDVGSAGFPFCEHILRPAVAHFIQCIVDCIQKIFFHGHAHIRDPAQMLAAEAGIDGYGVDMLLPDRIQVIGLARFCARIAVSKDLRAFVLCFCRIRICCPADKIVVLADKGLCVLELQRLTDRTRGSRLVHFRLA